MTFLKESFIELIPYHAQHITDGIKLDANENPYPMPVELATYISEWCKSTPINRYPDTDALELRKAIATHYGVTSQNIICGVGSDQLIDCILRAVLQKGDDVVMPHPSFSMYQLSTVINNGNLIEVPLSEDFTYNTSALLETIKRVVPKVVFLCNPNNPTGSILTLSEIRAILDATEALVVVDEAYGEFTQDSAITLTKEYTNLVVLRTFSKAYGLAGARIGYGIAHTSIIETINVTKPPYNLNIFSQEMAKWIISNTTYYQDSLRKIIDSREKLYEALKKLPLQVYPSEANFLWVSSEYKLDKILKAKEIYIRKVNVDQKDYFRISIGTDKENQILLETLKEAL